MRIIAAFIGFLLASGAFAQSVVGPTPSGSSGRTMMNNDPFVSTLDPTATGAVAVYGDLQEFDSAACYNGGNSSFCQTSSSATGSGASTTLTGVTLPIYMVGGNVVGVTGTNVAANSTVTSFTGTPGGTGTVTLNNLPTGTVTSVNFAQPANVISFQNAGTTSTTVTGVLGSNTITVGSSAWCVQSMAGTTIYIPGVTAPGTIIAGCLSSNKVGLSLPILAAASGGTYTITYGPNFTTACPSSPAAVGVAGCVGSTVVTPSWSGGGGQAGVITTVTAVYNAQTIAVSSNSSNIIANGTVAHFYSGRNDSTGVNAACAYAAANNLILDVPVAHFVPQPSRLCYAVKLRGNGRIATAGDSLAAATTVFPEPVVPPWDAALPSAPASQFRASVHLPNFIAAGLTPSWASTYDSLGTGEPNNVNDSDMYPAAFQFELMRANPSIAPKMNLCGVGGATMTQFDGNPAATYSPCITSTGSSFLSQVNTNAVSNAVVVGGTNNDGVGLDMARTVDAYLKITLPSASGGVMTTPNDYVAVAHHPYSRISNTTSGAIEDAMEYGAGYLMSFCSVLKCGEFDAAREGIKHLWGYDPLSLKFERVYDVPFGSSNLALPYVNPRMVLGFAFTMKKSGVVGNTFWPTYTGNGGVTDSRGPFIAAQIGYDQGQANIVWMFQRGGNTIGIQCDPTNLLPGFGCNDPATGKPPVIPSLMGNITVASGASPTITTTAANWGWTCATGATVAIPGAGTAQSVPGYGSYTEPWITTISTCTDSTHIVVAGTAPQNGTFNNSFVMLGNPVIATGITDTGDGTNEWFHFEVKGDELHIWWNSQSTPALITKVMRPRARFRPYIFSGGNRPSITIATDPVTAQITTFQVARPIPNLTTFTDTQVNGPAANFSLNNVTYTGPSGGDGNNHNTSWFGRVIRALYTASDLSIPTAGGIKTVVPTTGNSLTIPDAVGLYQVSPAGTLASLTLTLPSKGFKIGDRLTVPFNQIITALTMTPATGQTVAGAAVSAATLGQTLVYQVTAVKQGTVTNWQRVQ